MGMRKWIDILGEANNAHVTGEDEWFKYMWAFSVGVDLAKRKIASGEITPMVREYTVREMVEKLFPTVDRNDFGSKNFEDENSFDLVGPPVTRSRMAAIPEEKYAEPVLFMMWDSEEAMRLIGLPLADAETGKQHPVLIDGNHRLMKRYLDGDTGKITAQFIPWEDVKKVTVNQRNTLAEIAKWRK